MFEILTGTKIPFMRYRRTAYGLSLAILLIGVIALVVRGGFRMGVDFAGGVLVEYRFDRTIPTDQVRDAVADAGWTDAEIQASEGGKAFLIRIASSEERAAEQAAPSARIQQAIEAKIPGVNGELLREEMVGPRVGRELQSRAFWAVLLSMALILVYVAIRYELRYGFGGIIALGHDILVVLAYLAITDKEISIPVIAGLLTVAGYSINDKIVVFDRVRERKKGAAHQVDESMVDLSLNQTLTRTIITGLCVIFCLEALIFMGGKVIHDFALVILIGVLVGTYSSIFIGSGITLDLINAAERRRAAAGVQAAKLKA